MTIAIDMHLIPRWDKKSGTDLTRSRRKNSTGTFERDITAQCVDGGPRLVLGVLHMGGVLEDVPDFVRSLIAVCRSVDCNIRAVCLIVNSSLRVSLRPLKRWVWAILCRARTQTL